MHNLSPDVFTLHYKNSPPPSQQSPRHTQTPGVNSFSTHTKRNHLSQFCCQTTSRAVHVKTLVEWRKQPVKLHVKFFFYVVLKPASMFVLSNKILNQKHLWRNWGRYNTGLFEMIVGALTTCHTQYTWDRSIRIFLFNRTTLQVFVTYLIGASTCHTQYTWDRSICIFYLIEHYKFLLHTL